MLEHLLVLTFLAIGAANNLSTTVIHLPKCCDSDEWLVEESNTIFCNASESSRAVIQASAFLGEGTDEGAQCVGIFHSEILTATFLNGSFFPAEKLPAFAKCCPVSFFYNPQYHSCVSQPNQTNPYDNPHEISYLKIGLPHCDIVSDEIFEVEDDYLVKNGSVRFRLTGEVFRENQFCLDETVDRRFIARVCRDVEICEKVRCIHKCCPDGKSFINGSHCEDTFEHGLDFQCLRGFVGNYSDDFAIIHGYPGKLFLDGKVPNYYLDQKGNFHDENSKEIYPPSEQIYCIEHATKNGTVLGYRYFGIIVGTNPPMQTKFLLNRWALIISEVFLVVTIVFYVFTKETKKVFGKTLVSFCVALLILYGLIVYSTFKRRLHYKSNALLCKTLGFSIIYLGFSCFVWLQIICFDIYWTFGSSNKYTTYTEKRRKEFKRFLLYSLYGWGSSLLMTLTLVLFYFVNVLPPPLEIKMGVTKCAIEKFGGNHAEILFRCIPLTIIQVVNFYLFVKTVLYCLKVKRDIKKMNQTALNIKKKKKFFAKRERFLLVIKLSFTMGIFYLFEVVSSFFDFNSYKVTSVIEIIWDIINSLQGLFIFLIFVCKKKNFLKCKKSVALEKIRKVSLSSTMTTSLSSVRRKISNVRRKTSKVEAQET